MALLETFEILEPYHPIKNGYEYITYKYRIYIFKFSDGTQWGSSKQLIDLELLNQGYKYTKEEIEGILMMEQLTN